MNKTKRCPKCHRWHSGTHGYCHSCEIAYQRNYKITHAAELKKYRLNHQGQHNAYYRKWYKDHGRKRRADYQEVIQEWERSTPGAQKARNAIQTAIHNGTIIRPKTCSKCVKTCTPHAHHEDYRKPLDVRWLCASCHKQYHCDLKSTFDR